MSSFSRSEGQYTEESSSQGSFRAQERNSHILNKFKGAALDLIC